VVVLSLAISSGDGSVACSRSEREAREEDAAEEVGEGGASREVDVGWFESAVPSMGGA